MAINWYDLVTGPGHFDVLVMENFPGDILNDVGAATIGRFGMRPSGNIGNHVAYFEPIHGSASTIAGGTRRIRPLKSSRPPSCWGTPRRPRDGGSHQGRHHPVIRRPADPPARQRLPFGELCSTPTSTRDYLDGAEQFDT
ncbi:isocitrate/isopropylmalate family dehydrogenase [Saccharopolyspora sp. ASAGF58]|uniref:isocitrate/isopropylmalate family dehydrogenase n=1 Tax=Saccharopolyspora sp. ASAGF58 TaxID=2719023 RepID=UPI001445C00C|nr:isocitrate/isopropylmalate family dehydrogenase [Saccharopolyspora sp. ASAGF58]